MRKFQLNPISRRRWERFRQIRRGYFSLITLTALIAISLLAELLVNNRALFVHYDGQWFFPAYGAVVPGKTFGLDYEYETDYKALQKKFAAENNNNWVILPPV
ncbi:MAG: peptide transporter permease, partial [Verrucomicrobiaceae bacterium]|nr:peptide transporter permease [Verrucomicrobiaceae bacterium]